MTFLYVYVTDSSCTDVCGSVNWRCSSSETGVGEYVQPKEDGDVLPRDAASAIHDAADWIPTKVHGANEGEVVGDGWQQTCLLYHKCKTIVMLKQNYVNPYCNVL